MKTFIPVIVVFAILVARVFSEEVNVKEVPNQDIIRLLNRIIKRLDTIEYEVKTNRDETKDVRKQVKANQEVLLRLDIHVRDQQAKLKEVTQKTEVEQQEITENTKSVKEVADRTAELTKIIDVNLRNLSKDVRTVKEVLTAGKCDSV